MRKVVDESTEYALEQIRGYLNELESKVAECEASQVFQDKEYWQKRCQESERQVDALKRELSEFKLKHATLAYEHGMLLMERHKSEQIQNNEG